MNGRYAAVLLSCLVVACSNSGSDSAAQRTQRQRDSVIANSKLPGAQGVRGALDAADAAAARQQAADTIR